MAFLRKYGPTYKHWMVRYSGQAIQRDNIESLLSYLLLRTRLILKKSLNGILTEWQSFRLIIQYVLLRNIRLRGQIMQNS